MKPTPELARQIRLAGKYDQDPTRYDERTPKNGSVTRTKLTANVVGSNELSGSATDDGLRAVSGTHVKTNFLAKRHVPDNLIDSDLLSGSSTTDSLRAVTAGHLRDGAAVRRVIAANAVSSDELQGSATDDSLRAVKTTHLRDRSVTSLKIAVNGVGSDELAGSLTDDALRAVKGTHIRTGVISLSHCESGMKNPAQTITGLRAISGLLGGDSLSASAGNHGHSSGSVMNIDRLPVEDRRRILRYRAQVIEDLPGIGSFDESELRIFVENLANVALDALSLVADSPDMDADERQARRDAGEKIPENWEHRESDRRRAKGITPEDPNQPDYFATQPHYTGERIPRSIRRTTRPDKPKAARRRN